MPIISPLGGLPPSEVHLANAPLARVLAQVRFQTVLAIEASMEKLSAFQDEIRGLYPVFKEDKGQELHVEFGAASPIVGTKAIMLRRFTDLAGDWTITLASDAITLEARRYESRGDLLARLEAVLGVLERAFAPSVAMRLGMRYITRVTDEGYDRVDEMVRPDLLGVAVPELRKNVKHAISEAAMNVDEGDLSLRWGILPANGTFDPTALEPIAKDSWVLDIDVSHAGPASFDTQAIVAQFDALAQRAYAMFRYMVTDQFLILYGGKL